VFETNSDMPRTTVLLLVLLGIILVAGAIALIVLLVHHRKRTYYLKIPCHDGVWDEREICRAGHGIEVRQMDGAGNTVFARGVTPRTPSGGEVHTAPYMLKLQGKVDFTKNALAAVYETSHLKFQGFTTATDLRPQLTTLSNTFLLVNITNLTGDTLKLTMMDGSTHRLSAKDGHNVLRNLRTLVPFEAHGISTQDDNDDNAPWTFTAENMYDGVQRVTASFHTEMDDLDEVNERMHYADLDTSATREESRSFFRFEEYSSSSSTSVILGIPRILGNGYRVMWSVERLEIYDEDRLDITLLPRDDAVNDIHYTSSEEASPPWDPAAQKWRDNATTLWAPTYSLTIPCDQEQFQDSPLCSESSFYITLEQEQGTVHTDAIAVPSCSGDPSCGGPVVDGFRTAAYTVQREITDVEEQDGLIDNDAVTLTVGTDVVGVTTVTNTRPKVLEPLSLSRMNLWLTNGITQHVRVRGPNNEVYMLDPDLEEEFDEVYGTSRRIYVPVPHMEDLEQGENKGLVAFRVEALDEQFRVQRQLTAVVPTSTSTVNEHTIHLYDAAAISDGDVAMSMDSQSYTYPAIFGGALSVNIVNDTEETPTETVLFDVLDGNVSSDDIPAGAGPYDFDARAWNTSSTYENESVG
jgi:hypothetical protein